MYLKNIVEKISYQIRKPFRIFEYISCNGYLVQQLYKPGSQKIKFMTQDLYIISLVHLPFEPFYGSNIRYLNYIYSPTNSLLKKLFKIELYNEKRFHNKPFTTSPKL